MKDIFKYLWSLCLTVLLFTGCYREDIAYIHNKIDNLELKTVTDQIEEMKEGIADLQALQEQITPIVKALQDAREGISKDIAAIQARIEAGETLSTELQAQLISLQSQYKTLDAAYKLLNDSRLVERMEELEALVSSSSDGQKDRMTSLETAAQALATSQALGELGAAMDALRGIVDVIPAQFEDSFDDAFSRCKESVLQWVSDSEAFKDLLKDYYTIAEAESLLEVLRATDTASAQELSELKKSAEKTEKEIRALVEDAVKGVTDRLGERLDGVEAGVKALSSRIDDLSARVEALENLFGVIGDYDDYKSDLISDILKLQDVMGEDDTLASLANTLKLVLSQSEQSYYDLAKIVNEIASVRGGLAGQEELLKSYEELVKSKVDIEKFTALRSKVLELSSAISGLESASSANILAVQELAEKISDIMNRWTDATLGDVSSVTDEIVKLKAEDARLRLALEQFVKDDNDRNEANHMEVIDLIIEVNESLAGLIARADFIEKGINDINEAIKKINETLEGYQISVNGLQEILTGLDGRIKDIEADIARIWAVIGTETLEIEGSLINAINVLNSRFGGVEGILGITNTLKNDLALLQTVLSGLSQTTLPGIVGDDPQAPSLAALKELLDNLTEAISGKADKSALPAIEDAIKGIQTNLVNYAVELDGELAKYIKSEDAAKEYATLALLASLVESYEKYVGDFDAAFADQSGTVIAAVAALNERIGELESSISEVAEKIKSINGGISDINDVLSKANGIIGEGALGEWAADLTAAVNYLYSLVGDKSVADQAEAIAIEQATQITRGIISTLVQAILGEEGDADDIKKLLDGFGSSFSGFSDSLDELFESVGNISDLKDAQNPDIAHMISNIKAVLSTLSHTYAAKQHKHSSMGEVEGLNSALDIISASISGVSSKLDKLDEYVKGTLVGLINDLEDKFYGYTTPEVVDDLIDASQNILAGILLNGDDTKFNAWFASLNLTSLSNRIKAILEKNIADIIKDGGTIDLRAKVLVDKAFDDLNIEEYLLTIDGFNDDIAGRLKAYATNESVSSMLATATAIAALDIALGEKDYKYSQFNLAVQDVYTELQDKFAELQNSLNDHVLVFGQYKTDYDTFKKDFGDFLAGRFTDVKNRLDRICPLIGDGFTGKTITEVINEILDDITNIDGLIKGIKSDLADVIGREAADSQLISGLQTAQSSLIAALFGGKIPAEGIPDGGYVADFEKRISALETSLAAIGFDDVKDGDGNTLAEVISGINSAISDLRETIGPAYNAETGKGYDKDHTLASAIGELNAALEGLVAIDGENGSTKRLADLSAKLQSLLAALGGKSALTSLSDISDLLNQLESRLNSFKDVEGTTVEYSLNDLKALIDKYLGYVDVTGLQLKTESGELEDWSGTILERALELRGIVDNLAKLDEKKLSEIKSQLADITIDIVIAKIRTGLYDFPSEVKIEVPLFGGFPITIPFTSESIISFKEYYWNQYVSGGNSFISLIDGAIDLLFFYRPKEEREQMKEDTRVYISNQLISVCEQASQNVADFNKLDFDATSLVDAINTLYDLLQLSQSDDLADQSDLDALKAAIRGGSQAESLAALVKIFNDLKALVGTSTSGQTVFDALQALMRIESIIGENNTGYSDVWSAISDLSATLLGNVYRVNSLAFMPDYEDGKATYNRAAGVTMKFKVNASPAFFERFGEGKILVKGYLKTNAAGKGTSINGTNVSLDDDVLSVTFAAGQFSGKTLENGHSQIAVSLVDSSAEVFVSEYVSLYIPRW